METVTTRPIAGGLTINPLSREVRVRGKLIKPTPLEYALLQQLASEPNRVFTRQELLRDVWGFKLPPVDTRTIDTCANRLRRKLAEHGADLVITVRGVGYRLTDVPEDTGEGRFLITETCEYMVHAPTAEAAEELYLGSGGRFLNVVERLVQEAD